MIFDWKFFCVLFNLLVDHVPFLSKVMDKIQSLMDKVFASQAVESTSPASDQDSDTSSIEITFSQPSNDLPSASSLENSSKSRPTVVQIHQHPNFGREFIREHVFDPTKPTRERGHTILSVAPERGEDIAAWKSRRNQFEDRRNQLVKHRKRQQQAHVWKRKEEKKSCSFEVNCGSLCAKSNGTSSATQSPAPSTIPVPTIYKGDLFQTPAKSTQTPAKSTGALTRPMGYSKADDSCPESTIPNPQEQVSHPLEPSVQKKNTSSPRTKQTLSKAQRMERCPFVRMKSLVGVVAERMPWNHNMLKYGTKGKMILEGLAKELVHMGVSKKELAGVGLSERGEDLGPSKKCANEDRLKEHRSMVNSDMSKENNDPFMRNKRPPPPTLSASLYPERCFPNYYRRK